jgi:hypothetical protein
MVARRLQQVCTYGVKAMVVARDCARAGPTWSPRGTLETSTVDGQTTHYYNDASDKPVTVDGPGYNVTHTYDALDRLAQRNGVNLGDADLTNNAARVPTPDSDALIFRGPDGTPLSDKPVLARESVVAQPSSTWPNSGRPVRS